MSHTAKPWSQPDTQVHQAASRRYPEVREGLASPCLVKHYKQKAQTRAEAVTEPPEAGGEDGIRRVLGCESPLHISPWKENPRSPGWGLGGQSCISFHSEPTLLPKPVPSPAEGGAGVSKEAQPPQSCRQP